MNDKNKKKVRFDEEPTKQEAPDMNEEAKKRLIRMKDYGVKKMVKSH